MSWAISLPLMSTWGTSATKEGVLPVQPPTPPVQSHAVHTGATFEQEGRATKIQNRSVALDCRAHRRLAIELSKAQSGLRTVPRIHRGLDLPCQHSDDPTQPRLTVASRIMCKLRRRVPFAHHLYQSLNDPVIEAPKCLSIPLSFESLALMII